MATQQALEVGGAEFKSSRYGYDHLTLFGTYISTKRSSCEIINLGLEQLQFCLVTSNLRSFF